MRPTNRRRCGVLGGGLLLLALAAAAVLGAALFTAPPTAAQVGLLALAGALDLVAAFENPLTRRVEWFRLGGLANVALGLALPVGLFEWGLGGDAGWTLLVLAMAVGGLSLAAIGADLFLYAGAHVYGRPVDAGEGSGVVDE
jgi:hypothetical protein